MCTYRSPYYFPPHELLQTATCIREWTGANVVFLDAIAENLREQDVMRFLQENKPDFLVTLLGVETISTDLACAASLREAVPGMRLLVFGYYPTRFPEEILENATLDAVLLGDPEESCCSCLTAMIQGESIANISGVAGRDANGRVFVNAPAYITDMDALPFPDYTLITLRRYSEMLLGGPFAIIQTTRGCPYSCSYCTSPQDRRYVTRCPEGVVDELEGLIEKGAKVVRFLDDTFTADRQRVITICREIIHRKLSVKWNCLARVDTLDEEALFWMKRAGCVRVVVGVESYSSKVLKIYNKYVDPDTINPRLQWIHDAGMESIGFIIVGGPFEGEEDFELTRRGVLASSLDLAIVDAISLYGGSALAKRFEDQIEFQLIPHVSRWRDPNIDKVALDRERSLYCQFYFRPKILFKHIFTVLRFPTVSFKILVSLIEFALAPFKSRERRDLF